MQPLAAAYGVLLLDGGTALARVAELAIGTAYSSRVVQDGGCLVESYAGSDGGYFGSNRLYRRTGTASWGDLVTGSRVTE
jgi:glutamine amidotransferase-like uncharacterized protein